MGWLREHWFKLGILIAVLLIAASPAYYFVYYLPKQAADAQSAKAFSQYLQGQQLQDCLNTADSDYSALFTSDCKLRGNTNCDTNPTLDQVTIAALQKDRDNQKDFCFKQYSQN